VGGSSFLASSDPLGRFGSGGLLSLFEAVAITVDGEDFGAMHEAVHEGDDAGGVGEDLVPFAECFVGGQDRGALLRRRTCCMEPSRHPTARGSPA
jgi:hypothetical protein